MKKIVLLVLVIAALSVVLTACSGSATPSTAWADEETLEYQIINNLTKENKGNMKVVTVRNPFDKTLGGKEYSSADGKVTIDITLEGQSTVHTEILTTKYTVLATHKVYTDLVDTSKSYELNAYHSGKNYVYTLNGGEEKKLKTGSSGYTDSDYIYHYIRCYPLTSPPSSIKVADPINNEVLTVSCSAYASTDITVPYPDGSKQAACTGTAVSLSSAPKGKSITVCFTPDSADYYMNGWSISPSKKIPVEIIENDLTYKITAMSVK